ncbi:hypothetical protein NL108_000544, partial [Boleophthalmus pectinirostris]
CCYCMFCHPINVLKKDVRVPFYRIPADKDRRQKWIADIKREGWEPTEYNRLCRPSPNKQRRD